jgi:hypothetical protein
MRDNIFRRDMIAPSHCTNPLFVKFGSRDLRTQHDADAYIERLCKARSVLKDLQRSVRSPDAIIFRRDIQDWAEWLKAVQAEVTNDAP